MDQTPTTRPSLLVRLHGPRDEQAWAEFTAIYAPLIERLERSNAAMLMGAGEITVEPRSSHGVHLHISRYHFP